MSRDRRSEETLVITLWEGDCVRHPADEYVGVHAGYTYLAWLIQRAGDLRAVRVRLPDGTIRVASEHSLEAADAAAYGRYAASIGADARNHKPPTWSRRV
jgi:hypothetical protein